LKGHSLAAPHVAQNLWGFPWNKNGSRLSFSEEVEFMRGKDVRPRFIVWKSGGSRMYWQDRSVAGKAAPILTYRDNCGGAEEEDISQHATGFIDRVFNLVQRVLQKHEIPEALERHSGARTDLPASFEETKKTGAEISAPVGRTNAARATTPSLAAAPARPASR
jgi:hypothetical protein